jgi:hypothetical protein
MKTIVLILLCIGFLVVAQHSSAGEELVYTVVHKGTDYDIVKTEIHAIDPETNESRQVFSDANTSITLVQRLYVFHFPVAGGNKLFAHAAQREEPIPFPGNAALYELSTDGSNSFRKIAPVLGTESLGDIFVNSSGTRIGYLNRLSRRQFIFVHDVATGKLAHQIDITDVFLDCYAVSIGWLPDSDRIYFSLATGDVHITSEASFTQVGTYLMVENGEHLTKLDPVPALPNYSEPETERLIGVLPSGEYILEIMQRKKRPAPGENQAFFAIVRLKPEPRAIIDISFNAGERLYSGIRVDYNLSPSGNHLAAAKLPISSSATSHEIWLQDLQADEERIIISLPTEGLQGPFLGIVGWLDR